MRIPTRNNKRLLRLVNFKRNKITFYFFSFKIFAIPISQFYYIFVHDNCMYNNLYLHPKNLILSTSLIVEFDDEYFKSIHCILFLKAELSISVILNNNSSMTFIPYIDDTSP